MLTRCDAHPIPHDNSPRNRMHYFEGVLIPKAPLFDAEGTDVVRRSIGSTEIILDHEAAQTIKKCGFLWNKK